MLFKTLLAGAAAAQAVSAQSIIVDGQKIDNVDSSSVSPAAAIALDADIPEDASVLTDDVLANLTSLDLTDIELFAFDDEEGEDAADAEKRWLFPKCKTFPGDLLYPGTISWKVFNLLTGGALIKTVPIGAVCYRDEVEHYDEAKCQALLEGWESSDAHHEHPTSLMSPLYQGATCMPQNNETGSCELGGFPVYSVKATNVAQIQLAVNFARNRNIRLVIRNTGHDFLGKNTGAGSLSIWTHNLKGIKFIENYKSKASSYTGAAFKLGAGVQVQELYEAAEKQGYTAVGGECRSVGVTGGFTAGGGHSPMSPLAGLGSDQVLSVDIVLPNGRHVTADESQNTDLFWAIRGGGGATFGVVTSMTVRVYPKVKVAGFTLDVSSAAANMTSEVFWAGIKAYWRRFPEFSDVKTYGYSMLFNLGPDGYVWSVTPFMVPEVTLTEFQAIVKPLLEEWESIGFKAEPEYFEYDTFYEAWKSHFPSETVGNPTLRTASRLIPAKNWEDPQLFNETADVLQSISDDGSALIGYNINAAVPEGSGIPDSAANPAWRDARMFVIIGGIWDPEASTEEIKEMNSRITDDWMGRLRKITPGGGGYGNEGDVMEPNFGQAFFGSNYDRLLQIKQKVDPRGVLYAPTAVGSENWYIEGQEDWLTLQTGRLCRK